MRGGKVQLKATDYTADEILKIMREWTGLTQKEFAESIYRTERNIQSYEQAERQWTVETLLQIARTHGIDITISKDAKINTNKG